MTPSEALITLNLIPSLGSIRIGRLLEFFGSPEIALHADADLICQVKGIGPTLANAIKSWRTTVNPEREFELVERAGVKLTTIFDEDYPAPLRQLPDPPFVLYSKGQWLPQDGERSVAIVGSRRATAYGREVTRSFVNTFVMHGVTVISGLALGIDTEAHLSTLDAGGRTIAVIGSGLNRLYPNENMPLAQRIVEQGGAVVSEFPMELMPSKSTFPMRNRIVSGWTGATVVMEAPAKSGALITAQLASEQGKIVYAVPGLVTRDTSSGCHQLIRDGATLATCAEDILDDMRWNRSTPAQPELPIFNETASPAPLLSEQEQLVLHSVELGFNSIDALSSSTGLPASQLTGILLRLQMYRLITPKPGGLFAKS